MGADLASSRRQHTTIAKSSPWKNGSGDIVADFIASCRTYALCPGLYYHTGYNADCNVDNPGRVRYGDAEAQVRYNRIVDQQCTDVVSLLWDLQPQAVVFQGLKGTGSLIR
ncbi:hypothetical protein CMK14_18580 [Candidatus Poribacteria bacterium]|nr:hypothetical protein [Candidatus Poribacteria bacterium]